MPEMVGSQELASFTTILIGLAAMFGATIYTLQSRHHGIDGHERSLQNEYYRLYLRNPRDVARMGNIKRQINIVRRRYNYALVSYILMMVQELVIVMYVAAIAANVAYGWRIWTYHFVLILCLIPGAASLLCHIRGDLILAFETQRISREWIDHADERVNRP